MHTGRPPVSGQRIRQNVLKASSSVTCRSVLSVKVRQCGESRKCWLPQYFYPPEDLQVIGAEGNLGYGGYVDIIGIFHVQDL
jgi:hypothetical protein